MRKNILAIMALWIILACFPASRALAYLVDTGPGPTESSGWSLFHESTNFQYLAAEFTLGQLSTITGIEGWISIQRSGFLSVLIYNDDDSSGDIPGTPTTYSQSFYLENPGTSSLDAAWHGPSGLSWTLGPGTYWVAFEVPDIGFHGAMAHPSGFPLGNEAFYCYDNTNYHGFDSLDIGVRIDGSAVPLPGALLLLGSGLISLAGFRSFRKS